MKQTLVITFLLFAVASASGQGIWNRQAVNNKVNRLQADSVAIMPRDTSATNNALYQGAPVGDSGRIAYQFGKFWGHYGVLGWKAIGSDPDLTAYYTKLESDARFKPIGWLPAISDVTGLQAALDGKEPVISAGTTAQYWRGDKTWQDFTAAARSSLSAGTGISFSAGVISNTAPDQPVSMTGGTGISVTGTYPNFTVTNIAPGGATPSWQQTLAAGASATTMPTVERGNTLDASLYINGHFEARSANYPSYGFHRPGNAGMALYLGTVDAADLRIRTSSNTDYKIWHDGYAPAHTLQQTLVAGNTTSTNIDMLGSAAVAWGSSEWAARYNAGIPGFELFRSGGEFVLTNAGNVGIGTPNPTYKFDVNGSGHYSGNVTLGASGSTTPYAFNVKRQATSANYTMSLGIRTDSNFGIGEWRVSDGNAAADNILWLQGDFPVYSRDGGSTGYIMWTSDLHPTGSVQNVTFTGAQVPANFTANSAGHVTSVTTRTLTAADIGVNAGAYYSDGSFNLNAGTLYVTVNGSADDQIVLFPPTPTGNAGRVIHIYNFNSFRYEIDGIGPITSSTGVLVCNGSFWLFRAF